MLEDPEEPVFLSSISALEIAIKWSRRKLILPEPPLDFINKILLKSGISQLAVTIKDACRVAALPYHHNDPFDRLMVAQARENGLRLMTANPIMERYDVDLIALWLDDDE
jgi:PIN domain nuclease of toxin-antitoxin system